MFAFTVVICIDLGEPMMKGTVMFASLLVIDKFLNVKMDNFEKEAETLDVAWLPHVFPLHTTQFSA